MAKKSTVNKAGNYTKPEMRKRIFNRIKAGGKGGNPGQWSARKAQMLAKAYKAAGGGYKEEGGKVMPKYKKKLIYTKYEIKHFRNTRSGFFYFFKLIFFV